MKNSIDVKAEFSFKGENYTCSANLDLEQLLHQHDDTPCIHELLAAHHGIDTYSYLYEVMLESDLEFSNPTGLATRYMTGDQFDLEKLDLDWETNMADVRVQRIAANEMRITDLDQQPALKRALLAAYYAGRKA